MSVMQIGHEHPLSEANNGLALRSSVAVASSLRRYNTGQTSVALLSNLLYSTCCGRFNELQLLHPSTAMAIEVSRILLADAQRLQNSSCTTQNTARSYLVIHT